MRKNRFHFIIWLFAWSFAGCIGTDILDDTVDSEIVILNPVQSIEVGTTYPFMAEYRNMTGMAEDIPLTWNSSEVSIISIDSDGLATALSPGDALITVMAQGNETSLLVEAGEATTGEIVERTATLRTSSSYPLSGSATLTKTENGLLLTLGSDFSTTSALPGLYVYLSNNTSTTNNAYEIGRVTAFSGAQEYEIPDVTTILAYKYVLFFCKPFTVPVGHGELNP
jgi:hypothetical protein